ncbi:MAG: hypothetical protein E7356_01835 [Clostridiales bacterium]|nr:hypothetical protein [Clostridiales bacterium]
MNNIENIVKSVATKSKKDISIFKEIKQMDFVDIFPRSEVERIKLNNEAIKLGVVIEKTDRGVVYKLNNPIKTILGEILLVKIRKYDSSRLSWEGAGDFIVDDFEKFKEKHKDSPNCKFVVGQTYIAIEIKTENSLSYVMDIPTSQFYKV